ncbi:OsmC family protein [Psychrosphaera sp. B3R10]|uniref:OsmC family protein n=1 Tax=Psychrosphaera algicola TaxID=3023714 RepID=A0ABT5FH76_9GAMM|nr:MULTISPECIES: OsmC family protein [unclassified Psychrosphaera]MBU2882899.1 OsmC family protein [Psychrosphaera sp. I2R16]MBU2991296.1 OsmC family protein [Psychrosphaera sp. B3R10]MDC2890548.1 OsmC family protein [Psychrosphaera sp. G1-22]MDO6720185.1 OsmC family protein [Psychrosphaera sp. 1_MG-2023]
MKATVKWLDAMTFVGHSETGHKIVMDGDREGGAPTPMEMVLMSAGTCSAIDVVGILEKARQKIVDVEVELSGERADSIPKVFTSIHLNFVVTGHDIQAKHVERAVSLSAEKYCSVAKMLENTATITHSFEIKAA